MGITLKTAEDLTARIAWMGDFENTACVDNSLGLSGCFGTEKLYIQVNK